MTVDLAQYEFGPIKKKRHSLYWRASIFLHCLLASRYKQFYAEQSAKYHSSLDYDIIHTLQGNEVILVACDSVYFFDYAIPFLRSLSVFDETTYVHLHLINPSSEVKDSIRKLRIELSTMRISYAIDPLTGLDLPKRLNIYYNCSRFIVADYLLELGARRLLILDVDTIARSSPWRKLEGFEHEGAFSFRPKARKPWHKILAGTVYFENTPRVRVFAKRFATSLLSILARNPNYHIDQIIPFYLLKIGKRDFKGVFGKVPTDLMSLSYETSASLWMAKGREKYESKFQSEIESVNKRHQLDDEPALKEAGGLA
ncbi:hypothetical protein [uncultured Agrobacterium sp.]|uniref:hypothetical protein n=1 Tax=uncultured Agrobacterium sp. TaxID=157277 RepID=UPI00258834EE|nr:hypothetical protein [uncultured Agrobacterium sp.]